MSETIVERSDLAKIDMAKWRYEASDDVYWQTGLSYAESPADSSHETMGLFVPGAYFTGTDKGDGTYTCSVNETGAVENYTAVTAPFVIPVNTPGYSAMSAPTDYSSSMGYGSISDYTNAGIIVIFAGARGRDAGAPAGVVDFKAAIRYTRYNKDLLPGDTDSIFSLGMSGGGAQSALIGATGNSDLYAPYLEAIGAVMTESDAVKGSMCWCPITNLDVADEAYEWNMGNTRSGLSEDEQANVFHKAKSNIADFYTISDEEVRNGSYFRVSVAYRMEKRTETEKIIGFIPKDKFEYREFVEISEFYICYNANAVSLREIESGQKLSSNSVYKGFIVDKCGTDIKVVIKDNATVREETVSNLTSVIEPGSYKITTTTNLGKKYSSSITVTEGMNMSSVSPLIYINDKYQLDSSSSKTIPFGMSSLTTLKLGYQFDARLTSDSVSGFKAYGITGDSLSLFLRIKDFSKSENNGWMISSDAWGKKDKQKIVDTWAGVVGTGALVIQTSKDGKTWNDVDDGKYENGIYTADFYNHYGDQGDILIYTPDSKELQRGIYIRVLYAYQVEKVGSKEKTRVLEAYEMYLCSNELSAVTFHNMSVSDTLKETLGLDNEADVEVYKKAETLVSGSGTVTGFLLTHP